jgi:hypothetical protein
MKTFRIDLENEFEADMFCAMLDAEQIPNSVFNHHSLAYNGLFQMTLGWGHVEIPEAFRERAEALLEQYRQHQAEQSEG